MDYKFCMKCGYKMPKSAVFCPRCGTKQTSIPQDPQPRIQQHVQQTRTQPLHYDMSVTPPSGMWSDDKVMAFEQAMGFSDNPNDFVVVTKGSIALRSGLGALISPIASGLATASVKWFIVCFKDNGILLLGLNMFNHLTRKVIFVPIQDVESIIITYGHTFKIITKDGQKMTFHNKFMLGYHRWHHMTQNRKHLSELIKKNSRILQIRGI